MLFAAAQSNAEVRILIRIASRLQCEHALHQPIRRRDIGRAGSDIVPVAIHHFDQDGSEQLPLHGAALHFGHEQIELQLQAVAELADVELRTGASGKFARG